MFKLNVLISNTDYKDLIDIFAMVDDILNNAKNILFINELRDIIYKLHLLDINPEDLTVAYVNLLSKSNKFSFRTDEPNYKSSSFK